MLKLGSITKFEKWEECLCPWSHYPITINYVEGLLFLWKKLWGASASPARWQVWLWYNILEFKSSWIFVWEYHSVLHITDIRYVGRKEEKKRGNEEGMNKGRKGRREKRRGRKEEKISLIKVWFGSASFWTWLVARDWLSLGKFQKLSWCALLKFTQELYTLLLRSHTRCPVQGLITFIPVGYIHMRGSTKKSISELVSQLYVMLSALYQEYKSIFQMAS